MRQTLRYAIFTFLLTLALFLAPLDFISNAQNVDQDTNEIASALDENRNRLLDDSEILNAIQMWILGEALPDGETISDESILILVQLWITGESIRPPLMGDDPDDDAPQIGCTETPGTLLTQWGISGFNDGQFSSPVGVAVDNADNVYVADSGNSRVQKFTPNGTFLSAWGGFFDLVVDLFFPDQVAVDSAGNIYIADSPSITKLGSNGSFITKWEGQDSQFSFIEDLAVDSTGNLYVTYASFAGIQKFDTNGNLLTNWGRAGFGKALDQGFSPTAIAVDSADNVYVVDSSIFKYDSNGTFLTKLDNDEINFPTEVAVDSVGNIYIFDSGVSGQSIHIKKLDPNGKLLAKWTDASWREGLGISDPGSDPGFDEMSNSPEGMAVDSQGHVYVSTTLGKIQKFCGGL